MALDPRTEYGIFTKYLQTAETRNFGDYTDPDKDRYRDIIQKKYGNKYCHPENISKATAWMQTFLGNNNNDKQK